MSRNVECIKPESTLLEAASRMKTLELGILPVRENDRIVGMVTDRDIAVRQLPRARIRPEPSSTT